MEFPKIIHMTCKNKKNIEDKYWKQCYEKTKKINKKHIVKLYDDNDIYDLIKKHYPNDIDIVKKIEKGAILADVFRYLILYLEGGIYSDMDCMPLKPIDGLFNDHLINENTNIIVCKEWWKHPKSFNNKYNNNRLCQWFMIAKPKQMIFLNSYKECIKNISNDYLQIKNLCEKRTISNNAYWKYISSVMRYTGPIMFTKIINKTLPNDNLCILPCDYFCPGSGPNGNVHVTKNSYIKHLFSASWTR
tara:strand:- start:1212 stop:1949 length:738 start_codon:yes stop_codon:yes gene_type:complete